MSLLYFFVHKYIAGNCNVIESAYFDKIVGLKDFIYFNGGSNIMNNYRK